MFATKNSDETFMAIAPVSWDGKYQSQKLTISLDRCESKSLV